MHAAFSVDASILLGDAQAYCWDKTCGYSAVQVRHCSTEAARQLQLICGSKGGHRNNGVGQKRRPMLLLLSSALLYYGLAVSCMTCFRYYGQRFSRAQVLAAFEANKQLGASTGCWKHGMLVDDDAGTLAAHFRQQQQQQQLAEVQEQPPS